MIEFMSVKCAIGKFKNEVVSLPRFNKNLSEYTPEYVACLEAEELEKVIINPLIRSVCAIEKVKDRQLADYKIRILNFDVIKEAIEYVSPVIEVKEERSKLSYIYHESLDLVEFIYNGDRLDSEFYSLVA